MGDSSGAVVCRLAVVAGFCVAVAAPAIAQSVVYTGAVSVSSGDYIFAERTTGVFIVNGLEFAVGPVRVSGTVPVITQSTPWVTYGSVPVPSGGALGGEVARQVGSRGRGAGTSTGPEGRTAVVLPVAEGVAYTTSVGDPLVGANVELTSDGGSWPSLRVNTSAKVPLADPDDGFGTGAWDYGAGLSLAKRVRRGTLFAEIGYMRFGDLPELTLKDAANYSVAYGQVLGAGRWSVLTSFSGWSTIIDGADPPIMVGVGLARVFESGHSVSLNANVGVSETAPDVSLALGWRIGL